MKKYTKIFPNCLLLVGLILGCPETATSVKNISEGEPLPLPGVDAYSSIEGQPDGGLPDTSATQLDGVDGGDVDEASDASPALSDTSSNDGESGVDTNSLDTLGEDGVASDGSVSDTEGPVDVAVGEEDATDSSVEEMDSQVEEGWRSVLYPTDWFPGFSDNENRFLHDFSYAGYRNGAEALPSLDLDIVWNVVTDFGADPIGESDATGAIQNAIDAAAEAGGGIVFFPEGLFRADGKLLISASNVVLKGASSTDSRLFFSQSTGMAHLGHIRFLGNGAMGPDLPLAVDGESGSFEVFVEDATSLEVGQDIAIGWVITDAFIAAHDMTGTWEAFNGTWQPFFQREVVSIDTETTPHRVQVDVPLRYLSRVSDSASIRTQNGLLSGCGVEDLGLSNAVAWSAAWAQNQVHVLSMENVKDSWIRNVVSFSSPLAPTSGNGVGAHLQSSGILVKLSKRVSVVESALFEAENIGSGGNGYLFEVRQSDEILFRDCVAKNGRHNFIQNWGFGTTGCVWLRVESEGGTSGLSETFPLGLTGYSEFHHSLATANLIDSSTFHDGFSITNRGSYSTGAGHTGTETVFWNTGGTGLLRSQQFGWGYVIGTAAELEVEIESGAFSGTDSAPLDYLEGYEIGADLVPSSLYEDQLARRLSLEP